MGQRCDHGYKDHWHKNSTTVPHDKGQRLVADQLFDGHSEMGWGQCCVAWNSQSHIHCFDVFIMYVGAATSSILVSIVVHVETRCMRMPGCGQDDNPESRIHLAQGSVLLIVSRGAFSSARKSILVTKLPLLLYMNMNWNTTKLF